MADYFGYNKQSYGPGNIASASMVLFSIDNTPVRLAQHLNISYGREVAFKFELGSETVWGNVGRTKGTCEIARSVGDTGFLKPYKVSDSCGTQTLSVGSGSVQCGLDPGVISCSGCLLTSVGMTANAEGMDVTDNASYSVGSLSISGGA